jgi:hypothetical protein
MVEKDDSVRYFRDAEGNVQDKLYVLNSEQHVQEFFFGSEKRVPGSPSKKR